MKITFKRGAKPTGLSAVAQSHAQVDIKLDGKVVGWISPPRIAATITPDPNWRVYFMIKDKANPDKWKNMRVRLPFNSEVEAREWVKINAENFEKSFYRTES